MAKKYFCRPCMEIMIDAGKVKNEAEARNSATSKQTCTRCGLRRYCRAADVRWR